jgi:hypothetical protein
MKAIITALGALLVLASAAHADDAEGTIAKIDKSTMTLTLKGGESFKLSEEFALEDYSEGMAVMISYDEINGEKIALQIIPE